MKVRELISELKNFHGDMEVHFSYNYGDCWKTIVAPKVENVDEGYVIHSSYHSMPKVVDLGDDTLNTVVVISA